MANKKETAEKNGDVTSPVFPSFTSVSSRYSIHRPRVLISVANSTLPIFRDPPPIEFKDWVYRPLEQEVYDLLLNHPGYNKDFYKMDAVDGKTHNEIVAEAERRVREEAGKSVEERAAELQAIRDEMYARARADVREEVEKEHAKSLITLAAMKEEMTAPADKGDVTSPEG